MSLLKEFSTYGAGSSGQRGTQQQDLRTSDGSDAGTNDTDVKNDIRFSMMRNIINRENGQLDGADVQDYLERAHDLNDEVDSVAFGLETDDDDIIKVYVNAEQADEFEAEMSKLLGLEDDIEAAINTLAQKFDIVDVVWPEAPKDGSEEEDPDADLSIDDEFSDEDDTDSEADPEVDDIDAEADDDTTADADSDENPSEEDALDDDTASDDDAETDDSVDDGEADEDDEEPVLDADGEPVLDDDGNPVMRKKKKKKSDDDEDDTEVTEEGLSKLARYALSTKKIVEAEKPGKRTDGAVELDDIRKGIKPIFAKGQKVKSQEDYDKFLATFHGDHADVVDTHMWGDDIDKIADALHYHQKDKKVAAFLKQHVLENNDGYQGDEMSVGSRFLTRLSEAEDDEGGMDLSDTILKGLRSRLKKPYEKKVVELFSLCGVSGRYLDDVDGVGGSIKAGADGLRKGGRLQKAFNAFYAVMKTGGSGSAPTDAPAPMAEKKSGSPTAKRLETVLIRLGLPEADATEGTIATALRRTASKIDKSSDMEGALVNLARAMGIGGSDISESAEVSETDKYEEKIAVLMKQIKAEKDPEAKKALRARIQKLNDKIDDLDNDAINGWSSARMDAAAKDKDARRAMQMKSRMKGIKEDVEQLDEVMPKQTDPFVTAAISMMKALGLPQENLDYNGGKVAASIKAIKGGLQNAPTVTGRLEKMADFISQNKKSGPGATASMAGGDEPVKESFGKSILKSASMLTEAFSELEALTEVDMDQYQIEEPAAGPAMFAAYQGSGKHEDTTLIVGVDPEALDDRKSLRVGIDSPWDGDVHAKYFENTTDGYKQALQYANLLRSANLRKGGKPKGWVDTPSTDVPDVDDGM